MSEFSVGEKSAPQESENKNSSYLKTLRQKEYDFAVEKTRYDLEMLSSEVASYKSLSIPQKPDGAMRDDFFSLESLFELSEAGVINDVAFVKSRETVIKDTVVGKLTIEKLSDTHFGIVFPEEVKTDILKQNISKRVNETSISKAFLQQASDLLDNKAPELSSEFSFDDDPLAVAAVLVKLNFFGYSPPLISYDPRVIEATNIARNNISSILQKNASLDANDNISEVTIESKEGITIKLIPTDTVGIYGDLLKTNWKMAVIPNIDTYLLEKANQSPNSKCKSFINRPTGEALVAAVENADLQFAPDFEKFILTNHSNDFEDRYGGAYSQISRVLAKVIGTGEIDKLSSLFVSVDGSQPTLEQLKKICELDTSDAGFKALQTVIKDTLVALNNRGSIDQKMTKARVSIKAGACFDVASYYSQALDLRKLRATEIHGVKFFEKTHGAHTFINLEPMNFGGVMLPKGSLFTLADDGGLAFLRFTPFMFDNRDDMVSAFGSEVIKAESNREDLNKVIIAMDRAIGVVDGI